MPGIDLSLFQDMFIATGSLWTTGPRDFIAEAHAQREYASSTVLLDAPSKKMVQGGSNIKFGAIFQGSGVGENYKSGQWATPSNPQRAASATVNWRKSRTHVTITDDEILLNGDMRAAMMVGSRELMFQQFMHMHDLKKELMQVSVWDDILEANFWRIPDYLQMEGTDGLHPNSLLVFLNEFTDGLYNDDPSTSSSTTAYSTSGNQKIHGFGTANSDATTKGRFKVNQVQYDSTKYDGTATSGSPIGNKNVIQAIQEAFSKAKFVPPKRFADFYKRTDESKFNIGTSERGQMIFMDLLRLGQNQFIAGPQDPSYPDPQFRGVPVKRWSALDSLAAYSDGTSTLKGQFAATNAGPRYYLWNSEYLYPVFHEDRYFHMAKPPASANVPDTVVIWLFVWYNLVCPSLRRHAIVYPSASVYTA